MNNNRLPFHEWMLDALVMASKEQMAEYASQLKGIKLPIGCHNSLVEAWQKRRDELKITAGTYGVVASLLSNKKVVEGETPAVKLPLRAAAILHAASKASTKADEPAGKIQPRKETPRVNIPNLHLTASRS